MEGVSNGTHDEAFATLEIFQPERQRKINLHCKVGTGAQSNVLPVRLVRIIAPEKSVYGCEKFHFYLCGKSFVVKTGHRP